MATDLQKDLAEAIVINAKLPRHKRKNKKELVASVGYALSTTSKKQKSIIEAKGVQEALEDFGFNESNAKKVVGEILLNQKVDPNARLKAATEVFKVRGSYAPDKTVNVNLTPGVEEKSNDVIARYLNGNRGNIKQ